MDKILEICNINKKFARGGTAVSALCNVSFDLYKGESLGIVGESGGGKSTLAHIVARLIDADSGSVWLDGTDITALSGRQIGAVYKKIQMIFQSPAESFNPRRTIGSSIAESLISDGRKRRDAWAAGEELLGRCGLPPDYMKRYPHQLSGGECQRAAIARALARNPQLLICDEATSALDVTVQMQILKLLKQLQHDYGISYLVISHDLALVQHFCDRMIVMQEGRIVEAGVVDEVMRDPQHAYTKSLIQAVLAVD